jgi:hypothetical protein
MPPLPGRSCPSRESALPRSRTTPGASIPARVRQGPCARGRPPPGRRDAAADREGLLAALITAIDESRSRRSLPSGNAEVPMVITAPRTRHRRLPMLARFGIRRDRPATSDRLAISAAAAAGDVALGLVLGYFLDPTAGRRRRHGARDARTERVQKRRQSWRHRGATRDNRDRRSHTRPGSRSR